VTENEVTSPQVTGTDLEGHHLTGSDLEAAVEGRKLAYTVHFTTYKAVSCRRRESRDGKWRHGTSGVRKWRYLTGSHLEAAVEGRKLAYTVHFSSYEAVAGGRRQSRDRKWCYVTSGGRNRPKGDVIWPEVTWKLLYNADKRRILYLSLFTSL